MNQRQRQETIVTAARRDGPTIRLVLEGTILASDTNNRLREKIRRRLRLLATEVFGGAPQSVYFEDECPVCECRRIEGSCPDGNCDANRERE